MKSVIALRRHRTIRVDQILHAAYLRAEDDALARQTVTLRGFGRKQSACHDGIQRHLSRVLRFGKAVVLIHHPREKRAVKGAPIDADANRLAVLDGRLDHGAEIVVVFLADIDVARIDAVLGQRAGAGGILLQQKVAVVVEVADDRHAHAEHVQRVDNLRDGSRGRVGVHGDAYQLRPGARQRHDLIYGGCDVGRIRVGHGLDHNRIRSAHLHAANAYRYRLAARDLCHPSSRQKVVENAYFTSDLSSHHPTNGGSATSQQTGAKPNRSTSSPISGEIAVCIKP